MFNEQESQGQSDDVMTDQQMQKVDNKIQACVTAMTSDPNQF